MGIPIAEIKLLWARSAGRCSLCNRQVTEDSSAGTAYPVGEQAHIIAGRPDGPRGDSPLTAEERDSYENLVLLCPTCHVRVDRNVADFPAEVLFLRKLQHERRIAAAVGKKLEVTADSQEPGRTSEVTHVRRVERILEYAHEYRVSYRAFVLDANRLGRQEGDQTPLVQFIVDFYANTAYPFSEELKPLRCTDEVDECIRRVEALMGAPSSAESDRDRLSRLQRLIESINTLAQRLYALASEF